MNHFRSQHTEWKESWRDDLLRWICGFANAEGGRLEIGRNDIGEIIGLADAPKLLEDLPTKIRDILGILVAVNLHHSDGKPWLAIEVDAYPNPISYRGHYYIRSGSTLQELKGAALDRFLLRKQGRSWDGVPVPRVKIGYFRSASDLAYHDEVHGNLFEQSAKTIDLVRTKYLKAAITYQGIQRIERYPVPDAALREAILNALVHRDYAVGAPVQIRVYEDRLKIWNPAVLPDGWTVENLLVDHASTPYNPALANAFFRAGEIETWGRGIQRIFELCQNAGAPAPIIDYKPNDLWIEFPFAPGYLRAIATTPQTEFQSGAQQETTQEKIISLLIAKPATTREALAKSLGITADGVKYHLSKLRAAGKIRHHGPTKAGHWEVKAE